MPQNFPLLAEAINNRASCQLFYPCWSIYSFPQMCLDLKYEQEEVEDEQKYEMFVLTRGCTVTNCYNTFFRQIINLCIILYYLKTRC